MGVATNVGWIAVTGIPVFVRHLGAAVVLAALLHVGPGAFAFEQGARIEAPPTRIREEAVAGALAELLDRKDASWVWVSAPGEKYVANIARTNAGTLYVLVRLGPFDAETRERVVRFFGRLNVKPVARKTWVGRDFHESSELMVTMDFGRDAHRAARVSLGLLDVIRGGSTDFTPTAELHCVVNGRPTTQCR